MSSDEKLAKYASMAENTKQILTQSKENWISFLNTSSKMYKYSFDDQVQIFTQRPTATACATFDFWSNAKKMNRHIKRGAEGIALIDNSGRYPKLKYVFDVADTADRERSLSKNPQDYIWKMGERNYSDVNEMLAQKYGADSPRLEYNMIFSAQNYVENNLERFINPSLFMDDEQRMHFAEIASDSVVYLALKRCDLNADAYAEVAFENIKQIESNEQIETFGLAVTILSKDFISDIEKVVGLPIHQKNINIERNDSNERNEQSTEIQDGERNAVRSGRGRDEVLSQAEEQRGERDAVHSGRGNVHVSPTHDTGRTDRGHREVRQDENAVSDGKSEQAVHRNDVRGNAQHSSSGRTEQKHGANGADSNSHGETGQDGRRTQSQRPNALGGIDEQLQNVSGRNNSQADSLRLNSDDKTAIADNATAVSITKSDTDPNIIGTANYRFIKNKRYNKLDTETALKVAEQLELADIKYSGRISGDDTTLTVSLADLERCKEIIDTVKNGEIHEKATEKEVLTAYTVGDFIELYGDDAIKVAQMLDMTLTRRNDEPMVGFANHILEDCSEKLNVNGYSLVVKDEIQQNLGETIKSEDEKLTADEFIQFATDKLINKDVIRNAHKHSDNQNYHDEVDSEIEKLLVNILTENEHIDGYQISQIAEFYDDYHNDADVKKVVQDNISDKIKAILTAEEQSITPKNEEQLFADVLSDAQSEEYVQFSLWDDNLETETQKSENIFQVITYSHDSGTDEKKEYPTLDEAIEVGRQYLADDYEGFAVYNKHDVKVEYYEGDFPLEGVFSEEVYRNSGNWRAEKPEYNKIEPKFDDPSIINYTKRIRICYNKIKEKNRRKKRCQEKAKITQKNLKCK